MRPHKVQVTIAVYRTSKSLGNIERFRRKNFDSVYQFGQELENLTYIYEND